MPCVGINCYSSEWLHAGSAGRCGRRMASVRRRPGKLEIFFADANRSKQFLQPPDRLAVEVRRWIPQSIAARRRRTVGELRLDLRAADQGKPEALARR